MPRETPAHGWAMTAADAALERGRAAYRRRDWERAREALDAAHRVDPLGAEDLAALANCLWWMGDLERALPLLAEVYELHLEAGAHGPAAMTAMDLGYTLAIRGDEAQASGWLSRAVRLLQDLPDSIERAFLAYLDFEAAFDGGELDAALAAAHEVGDGGRRFDDRTLAALGVLGEGRVRLRRGEVGPGMALLDEAMLAAVSDELDPSWAGNIYCHLMSACHEIADLRRAAEWTQVTTRWCEQMPGAGPFLGICRVHRAQVLQVWGAWDAAEREIEHVRSELAHFDLAPVAEATYLLGELRLRRGDLTGAEDAFREAHRLGRQPEPGMALLQLARGEVAAAMGSIRSALAATGDGRTARARLLPAGVEIAVAEEDVDTARSWAEELDDIAATFGTTGLTAAALHVRGMVRVAARDASGAVPVLRAALDAYRTLRAPFERARARLLLAHAYEELGIRERAGLERDAATVELRSLGIQTTGGREKPRRARPGGLTTRETEVLSLVARGHSNQQIADLLVLSVRTIERHLATVYQKLDLHGPSARAAAVTFAHRSGLPLPD